MQDSGKILWAGRFDAPDWDLLLFREQTASATAAQAVSAMFQAIAPRTLARTGRDATVEDLTVQAIVLAGRMDRESFMAARALLDRAMAMRPDYVYAHSNAVHWHIVLRTQCWATPADDARGLALAERAIAIDPIEARAYAVAGYAHLVLGRDPAVAIPLFNQAMRLNPGLGQAWAWSALARACVGDFVTAERQLAHHRMLCSPGRYDFLYAPIPAIVGFLRQDHAAAAEAGRVAVMLHPGFALGYPVLLAALGHLGETAEASETLARLRRIVAHPAIQTFVRDSGFAFVADRARLADGLRRAGLPV